MALADSATRAAAAGNVELHLVAYKPAPDGGVTVPYCKGLHKDGLSDLACSSRIKGAITAASDAELRPTMFIEPARVDAGWCGRGYASATARPHPLPKKIPNAPG